MQNDFHSEIFHCRANKHIQLRVKNNLSSNPSSHRVTMAGSLHLVATVPLSLKQFTLERGANCCGVGESTQGTVCSLRWVNGDLGVTPGELTCHTGHVRAERYLLTYGTREGLDRKAFPAFLKNVFWTAHLGPLSIQMVIPPSDYFSIFSLSRNSSTGRLPGDTGCPDAAATSHVSQGQASPAAGLGPPLSAWPPADRDVDHIPILWAPPMGQTSLFSRGGRTR